MVFEDLDLTEFGNRVPHMLDDDYSPLSAVEIFVKDLGLVLDTGHELRLPLRPDAEAHSSADRMSAAYRRYLKNSGIAFGVIR